VRNPGTDTTGDTSTNFEEGAVGQGKSYNGGLENYPRFHEDWGNSSTLFYRGSFVSLNRPRKVNGLWCSTGGSVTREQGSTIINNVPNTPTGEIPKDDGTHTYSNSGCNNYNAPTRNWDYDLDYNNAANLPPLTPRVTYLRQEVFSREFERPE
jgi:hypothetical protein